MNPIPFEKVAFLEAKAVLDNAPSLSKEENWAAKRRMEGPADFKLNEATYHWVLTLPTEVWPLWLMKNFPRIANQFAEAWRKPDTCEGLFVQLLLDQRGTRKGFPVNVSREIMALKLYFDSKPVTTMGRRADDIKR
ncbi:hypothetical protein [Glaciimonas sp. PCH181]|uniref:hypothetical protein n=1 Tax=Glaciimonas sp. PCH181 TaxID=2133943 RepID=UPI000D34CCAC|nr:hypothetical protein [Glaciimonas sp. PCH181]PUA17004.1 hypothetical protein C7W93_13640 [Glaciimonas sp. PCH181]